MGVLMRLVQFPAGLLAVLLVTAAIEPPPPAPPPAGEHTFLIAGARLTVEPGEESTYLRFSGGVTASGWLTLLPGLTPDASEVILSAETVELDVRGDAWNSAAVQLPEVPEEEQQRIVSDPGQVIGQMRAELRLRRASIAEGNLLRFGAKGDVVVRAGGLVLATSSLLTTDGGLTWSTEGRSTLRGQDPARGYQFMLAADYMLADSEGEIVLAQGEVEAEVSAGASPPVKLSAHRCELDLAARKARLESEQPAAGSRGRVRMATELPASAGTGEAGPGGTALTVDADVIEAGLTGRSVLAHGRVAVVAPAEGLRLRATCLRARLERGRRSVVAYAPVVRQGGSSVRGAWLRLTFGAERSVLEVFGPQHARLQVPAATGQSAAQ